MKDAKIGQYLIRTYKLMKLGGALFMAHPVPVLLVCYAFTASIENGATEIRNETIQNDTVRT